MGGALRLFRVRGVPVELHWSALLLLLFAYRFGEHVLARLGALVAIVLVHELGHALLVRRYGLKVQAIRIYAFGGECVHEAAPSMRQQVVIAWGGVLAQALLYGAAAGLLWLSSGDAAPALRGGASWPLPAALHELLLTFVTTNVAIAAFNLLPFPPLDGYKAWRLVHLLPRARTRRPLARTGARPLVSLVDDAVERARADAAAQRRAQARTKPRDQHD